MGEGNGFYNQNKNTFNVLKQILTDKLAVMIRDELFPDEKIPNRMDKKFIKII